MATAVARAAIQVGDRAIEVRELPLPEHVWDDEALLEVEGCGMCGTDYEQYVGAMAESGMLSRYPVIPGHEPVGHIARIGKDARRRWGVEEGDRVAVEPLVRCGTCEGCTSGTVFCAGRFVYSMVPLDIGPGLWGGFATHMLLRPGTVLHKVPNGLSVADAVLFNPVAAGLEWTLVAGGLRVGDDVLVMGPGQRGLACVVAAREGGARRIVVTGLRSDAHKLDLARKLGATDVLLADEVDVPAAVHELTGGRGVDVVVDVSAFATKPVTDAIDAVRLGGTIVLAGIKGMREVPGFVSDRVVLRGLRIVGVIGVSSWAYRRAIDLVASRRHPLDELHTHTYSIDELDTALRVLGNEVEGEHAVHVTVVPG